MEVEPAFASMSCMGNVEGGRVRRTKRRDIDWNAIEHDYHASPLSLRELAMKHGCSHSTIANFAGRHGWVRMRAEASDRSIDPHRQAPKQTDDDAAGTISPWNVGDEGSAASPQVAASEALPRL